MEYYVKNVLYFVSLYGLIIGLSVLFDHLIFALVASVVISIIRFFTSGFHCKKLYNCIIFTNLSFIIFGYCAKQSVDNLWVVFLIASFCLKDIWIKAPLKLEFECKTRLWHRKKMDLVFFILSTIIILCLYLNFNYMISYILYSIILVDLLLFVNIEE